MRENCQIRLFKFGSEANVFMIVTTSDYKNHVLKHCKELSPTLIGKWKNRLHFSVVAFSCLLIFDNTKECFAEAFSILCTCFLVFL